MRRAVHLMPVLAGLLAGTASAETEIPGTGAQVSGWLLGRFGYGLNAGNHDLVLNQQLLQLEVQHPDIAGWRFDGKLWAEREAALEPSIYRKVDIRELVVAKKTSSYSVALGRQIVVWGKADGFKLVDIVNPLDLRESILNDDIRSRLPLWMANVQFFPGEDQELQFLLIPQTYHHRIAPPGSQFDFSAGLPAGATVLPLQVPAGRPENWSFGARWSATLGDWNVHAMALRNLTGAPVVFPSVDPQRGLVLRPEVVRRTMIGAAADTSLGDAVLRLELAVTPDEYRAHATSSGIPELRRETAIRSLVGVDWTIGDWFVSPQLFNVHAPGKPGIVAEPDGTYASLVVERKFFFDKLTTRVYAATGLDRRDYWVAGSARYQVSDQLELFLGVDVLGGDRRQFFGEFNRRDRVVAGATIFF